MTCSAIGLRTFRHEGVSVFPALQSQIRPMSEFLEQLLSYCRENGRVCPVPMRWNVLYQMLPETRQKEVGWEPSLPLILAAWWESSDGDKQERLAGHIRWA